MKIEVKEQQTTPTMETVAITGKVEIDGVKYYATHHIDRTVDWLELESASIGGTTPDIELADKEYIVDQLGRMEYGSPEYI